MRRLETISRRLEAPLLTAANIVMLFMVILIFASVVSRYVFAHSYGFMEAFGKWSQIWIVYLILGVVTKERRHIAVDILPRRLPERYKTPLLVIFDVAMLGFAIVLFWSGIQFTQSVMHLGTMSVTEISIPMWIVRLCIPLGAIILVFFSIQHLITDTISLTKHRGDRE